MMINDIMSEEILTQRSPSWLMPSVLCRSFHFHHDLPKSLLSKQTLTRPDASGLAGNVSIPILSFIKSCGHQNLSKPVPWLSRCHIALKNSFKTSSPIYWVFFSERSSGSSRLGGSSPGLCDYTLGPSSFSSQNPVRPPVGNAKPSRGRPHAMGTGSSKRFRPRPQAIRVHVTDCSLDDCKLSASPPTSCWLAQPIDIDHANGTGYPKRDTNDDGWFSFYPYYASCLSVSTISFKLPLRTSSSSLINDNLNHDILFIGNSPKLHTSKDRENLRLRMFCMLHFVSYLVVGIGSIAEEDVTKMSHYNTVTTNLKYYHPQLSTTWPPTKFRCGKQFEYAKHCTRGRKKKREKLIRPLSGTWSAVRLDYKSLLTPRNLPETGKEKW